MLKLNLFFQLFTSLLFISHIFSWNIKVIFYIYITKTSNSFYNCAKRKIYENKNQQDISEINIL